MILLDKDKLLVYLEHKRVMGGMLDDCSYEIGSIIKDIKAGKFDIPVECQCKN